MSKSKEDNLPPPRAVFSGLKRITKKQPVLKHQPHHNKAADLVRALEKHVISTPRVDFVPHYKATDNIYGAATGEDGRPSLEELAALTNLRMGCCFFATNEVSADCVRNWHVFADPDSQKERKSDAGKAALKWSIKTDLRNQTHQWCRWDLGLGTSFLVKYFTAKDAAPGSELMREEPPNKPPKKFRAFSPRYMTPINLNKSNELDYQADLWKFSGGVFSKFDIHQDRIDVLNTRPEEGSWRGLSIFEPVWIPVMGYFNGFIYLTRGLRQWGDAVPAMFTGETIPAPGEISSILDMMDEYQMNYKWALGKDDRLEFHQTKIGSGLKDAFELYKEELSSAWRIPLNQFFGRSVGGGLAGAGALVSKEDYLQNISNKQMALSDNLMKVYVDAGFDVDGYDILWNMAVKKTDEQIFREAGMETQNNILDEQWKQAKLQTEMLKLQVEAARWQSLQPEPVPGEEGGGEGGETEPEQYESEEAEEDEEVPELSDLEKKKRMRFWKSIHIENHINFPYGDKR